MKKLVRSARGAVIAVVFALIVAAPAAAAQPTRTVYDLHGFVLPAGTACAFDVAGEPSWGFEAETDFSDGRVMYSVRAHGAYVNLATGARFVTADNLTEIDRFDAATGIVYGTDKGETSTTFLPGELGPFGVVTNSNGAFYHFVGTIWFTYDTNTGTFGVYAYAGTVTDICAALS